MRTGRFLEYSIVTMCLLSITAGMAIADKCCGLSNISTNIDLAYVSKYVWRGTVQNPDPAFQPSVTLSHPCGASFNFWGSMDTTGVNGNSSNFTEEDYTLNYAWETAKHPMSAGYIYYAFPNTGFASTQEVYFSTCTGGKVPTSFAVNYDFDEVKGLYGALTGSYACNVTPSKSVPTTMNLSAKLGFATAGYNESYFGVDKAGLVDFVLSASLPFETKKLKITPSVSYSTVVNSDLDDALAANGIDKNNFVAGLTLSSAF